MERKVPERGGNRNEDPIIHPVGNGLPAPSLLPSLSQLLACRRFQDFFLLKEHLRSGS